jgi:hypothetical protein
MRKPKPERNSHHRLRFRRLRAHSAAIVGVNPHILDIF